MKKFLLWAIISLSCFISWVIFADNIPDDVDIQVKDPLIAWEAANLKITMIKNGQTMSSYTWMIWIEIADENGNPLKDNEYTLPSIWWYEFLATDLGSKEFQRWLEIKKEWNFYIKVSDFIDETEYGQKLIKVINGKATTRDYNFDILNPTKDSIIIKDKLEILASIVWRNNSSVSIYIDDNLIDTVFTESNWSVNYIATNISAWKHTLRLTALDSLWNTLWTSDEINFTYDPQEIDLYKSIKVNPDSWLMVWDIIDITLYTDERAESVKMRLSDRDNNDSIPLSKIWNWEFFTNTFLISTWDIDISVEISASNNSISKTYENIQSISVSDMPEITNYSVEIDENRQMATIYWDTSNNTATSFLINYRMWNWDNIQEFNPSRTDEKSFIFTDVPYDTDIYLDITPYWNKTERHGAASETITFKITKPEEKCWNGLIDAWETCSTCPIDLGSMCDEIPETTCWNGFIDAWETCSTCPIDLGYICDTNQPKQDKCTTQNISTRTKKIWDSYYLIWDKVDNVSKYIVYSSTMPDGSDTVKVYETKDTSYEYPFDHTLEEDKFIYFWITWVCDDWEELQLTGATKVQVWPAENFFLLLCLTFLIYFWIKLFRQTE